MLDDPGTLHARDPRGLLHDLARLPSLQAGPDGAHPGPHGFVANGPAAVLGPLLAPWVDGPFVAGGTQVVVDGGFAGDEVAVWKLAAEASGARVITLGERSDAFGGPAADVAIDDGPLAAFEVLRYVGHVTGRHDAIGRLDTALAEAAAACAPHVPTEENPAKALAWRLWQRVPLLVTARGGSPLQGWVQQVFARVGKTLAVPSGEHAPLVAATAFEARHALGDDLVALVLGHEDHETRLVAELLDTRVAQTERLTLGEAGVPGPLGDPVLDAALVAYVATWVATYGALLGELDPAAADVYEEVRAVAQSDRPEDER